MAEGAAYFSGGLHIKSVTYFNGSIINSSVTDEVNNPVTIADHLRVDDSIYRMEAGGDNPLKVSDTIIPTESNEYDLGDAEWKFRNGYFSNTVDTRYINSQDIDISNRLTVGNDITTTGQIIIRDFRDRSPNYIRTISGTGTLAINSGDGVAGDVEIFHNGGIHADGNVIMGDTLHVYDTLYAGGDIKQDRNDNGAVKALVKLNSGSNPCGSYWTYNDSEVSCSRTGAGRHRIDFGFRISDRFVQVTAENSDRSASFTDYSGDNTIINIYTKDGQGSYADSASVITIY